MFQVQRSGFRVLGSGFKEGLQPINPERGTFKLFGSLDIVIWNLFVFWCLYFGIWHYFRRAGKPRNLKPNPTLARVIVMFPGMKYQAAGDNG